MQTSTLKNFVLLCTFACCTSSLQAHSDTLLINKEFKQLFTISDARFQEPYIDMDEWRDLPVRHRYIHGGFKGNGTKFSFYFPEKKDYEGRFFQYITPFPDNENLAQAMKGEEDKISFALSSGAYFVETNAGGPTDFTRTDGVPDILIGAYLANAASAQFSRVVAMELFGGERPFGYAYGGSGGAYRTVGGMESTDGVWDGVVPYVLGSPMAIPNVFTVRMHAMRVLHDKMPLIIDALEPGGSGDMYAGLNDEEKEALMEVTKMGFPPQAWFGYKNMGIHGFLVLYRSIVPMDKEYFAEDFWNLPGYLGSNPPASLLKARIQQNTRIKAAINIDKAVGLGLAKPVSPQERGTADSAWKSIGGAEEGQPVGYQLEDIMPDVRFMGGDLIIKSGEAAGSIVMISKVEGDKIILGPADPHILIKIKPGDEVQVDNSNFLAVQTYHRHQVPGKEYHAWDQFRDKDGNPIYPQRPALAGPFYAIGAGGVLPTGKFNGKMILLESLWDREAFAWQADWYRSKVRENLGDDIDNHFRLWYTDRALHGDVSIEDDPTRTVSYLGVLQQALRDLSAWVEKGIKPAATTNYKIVDSQVILPSTADERKGIQPVVQLKVNGSERADIKAGETATFIAEVEVPAKMGKIVKAAWNFEGLPENIGETAGWDFIKSGVYPITAEIGEYDEVTNKVKIETTYTFSKPGTYFPTLRVASQREGNKDTVFTLVQNLDRVRVVVE